MNYLSELFLFSVTSLAVFGLLLLCVDSKDNILLATLSTVGFTFAVIGTLIGIGYSIFALLG